MTKLKFLENIKDVQCIERVEDMTLCKREDNLVLLDASGKIQSGVSDSSYGRKIILDREQNVFVVLSSLFQERLTLYSYPDLKPFFTLTEINGTKVFFKDACFTKDGLYLYALADTASLKTPKTLLIKIHLAYQTYQVFFEDEQEHFDALFYSEERKALVLVFKKGKICLFSDQRIAETISLPSFEKMYFIDWGQVILLSSLAGFVLCSKKGHVIRSCDFLLPKEIKDEDKVRRDFAFENEMRYLSSLVKIRANMNLAEHYADMVFAPQVGNLFYLSHNINDDKYMLYQYSNKTFKLKKVYPVKGKVKTMELSFPHLYLRTQEGVMDYLIVHDE